MNNIKYLHVATALSIFFLVGCQTTPNATIMGEAKSTWDFDHKLQYKKTQLDDTNYKLYPDQSLGFSGDFNSRYKRIDKVNFLLTYLAKH